MCLGVPVPYQNLSEVLALALVGWAIYSLDYRKGWFPDWFLDLYGGFILLILVEGLDPTGEISSLFERGPRYHFSSALPHYALRFLIHLLASIVSFAIVRMIRITIKHLKRPRNN